MRMQIKRRPVFPKSKCAQNYSTKKGFFLNKNSAKNISKLLYRSLYDLKQFRMFMLTFMFVGKNAKEMCTFYMK